MVWYSELVLSRIVGQECEPYWGTWGGREPWFRCLEYGDIVNLVLEVSEKKCVWGATNVAESCVSLCACILCVGECVGECGE